MRETRERKRGVAAKGSSPAAGAAVCVRAMKIE